MTAQIARLEGYASLFNVADLNGDVVAPGAFRASLAKKRAEGLRLLYQHAPETPLGRWTHLEEDSRGLYVRGELFLDTRMGRDVFALIDGGGLDGLSIGFQTVRAVRHERRAGRFILEADLWEISIVTFPMAPGARIARLGPAETVRAPAPGAPPADLPAPGAAFAGAIRAAAGILNA